MTESAASGIISSQNKVDQDSIEAMGKAEEEKIKQEAEKWSLEQQREIAQSQKRSAEISASAPPGGGGGK